MGTIDDGTDFRSSCYVCGAPAPERDHFPVPKSLGGEATLPICRGCHDAKDRIPLDHWDPAFSLKALAGLWAKASRDERLMLAKMFHVAGQMAATIAAR